VSSTTSQSDNVPENYKHALTTPDVADWMKACDVEMGKLRSLGCWEVLPRLSLPQNASVMKSRWTFRYKTNELGNLKSVSHRSKFLAKGYSRIQGLHYFENYASVASFITLRLLFALTINKAKRLEGKAIMSAPPFFHSAGRGDVKFWGEDDGPTMVIWESL